MATIQELESRLNALEKAFLQSQKNQVPVTAKVDDTSNRVTSITPYTDTKTAYYGDTSITFYDAPQGNVSVFFDGYNGAYSVSRVENRLSVSFDALDKQTQVTISIQ
jgi:hypothetical protein